MSIVTAPSSPEGINWANQIGPIISAVISLAAIAFSYFSTRRTLRVSRENTDASNAASMRNTLETLKSKRIEEQKAEIYKKLNDFYAPFYQLRAKSKLLYDEFSERYKRADANFRTLTYLLDGKQFEGNEETLLKEIIYLGEKSENMIHEKAGLIDDEELRIKWFPKASTHYLILRLAYNGTLTGDVEKFKKHTFPYEVDQLVEKRIQALHKELEDLN